MLLISEAPVYTLFTCARKLVLITPQHFHTLEFGLRCQPIKHNMQWQRLSIHPQPHINHRDSSQMQVCGLTRFQINHWLTHRHQLASLGTYHIIYNFILLQRSSHLISIFCHVHLSYLLLSIDVRISLQFTILQE
jgi:hypothetical protein